MQQVVIRRKGGNKLFYLKNLLHSLGTWRAIQSFLRNRVQLILEDLSVQIHLKTHLIWEYHLQLIVEEIEKVKTQCQFQRRLFHPRNLLQVNKYLVLMLWSTAPSFNHTLELVHNLFLEQINFQINLHFLQMRFFLNSQSWTVICGFHLHHRIYCLKLWTKLKNID